MSFLDEKRKQRNKSDRLLDSRVESITENISGAIFKQLNLIEADLNSIERPLFLVGRLSEIRNFTKGSQTQNIIAKYVEEYAEKLSSIKSELGNPQFNDADRERTSVLINSGIDRINTRIDLYVQDIQTEVLSARLSDQKIKASRIRDIVEPKLVNNLNTEVTTQVDAFERVTTISKSRELGFNLFLYVGGLIKTSRPFCRERDGKIFTWEQVKSWTNGQIEPASVYLGGYNCRHHLSPISAEIAELEFGYKAA